MYEFKVESYRRNIKGEITLQTIDLKLDKSAIVKSNKEWVVKLGYGYKEKWVFRREDSFSTNPDARYRLHLSWKPKKGDVFIHTKSNRRFCVGEVEGFVGYRAPLIEGDKVVAVLAFEDYYKD